MIKYFKYKHISFLFISLLITACVSVPLDPPDHTKDIIPHNDIVKKIPINLYISDSSSLGYFDENFQGITTYLKNVSTILSPSDISKNKKSLVTLDIKSFIANKQKNPENQLRIILSDFSGEPYNLADYLIENYIKKGLSVGFLKLNSNTNQNGFILILGNYQNVLNFYTELQGKCKNLNYIQNNNFAIFTNDIIYKTILFDTQSTNNSQINPNNTDKEVFDLSVKDDAGNQIDSNPGLLLENSDPSVKEYEIEQATKSINIETTFSFQKRYFTPDFKILKPKVNVESWNNEKFVKDDNIKKAVFNIGYQTNENKFTDQILDKENLLKVIRKGSHCKFKTIIDTTKLTSGVKYRIDIALRPSVYINPSNPSTSSTSIYSLPNPNWRLVFVDKLLQEINSNKSNEQINVAHFIYYISKD